MITLAWSLRILQAYSTEIPAIMAFVVAIAGMMFPAIDLISNLDKSGNM